LKPIDAILLQVYRLLGSKAFGRKASAETEHVKGSVFPDLHLDAFLW